MMTIQELWNDIHKRTRHRGDSVIIDVIFQNGKPVMKRQRCPCLVLSQALIENNISNNDTPLVSRTLVNIIQQFLYRHHRFIP